MNEKPSKTVKQAKKKPNRIQSIEKKKKHT